MIDTHDLFLNTMEGHLLIRFFTFHVTSFNLPSPLICIYCIQFNYILIEVFGSYRLLECQINILGKKIIIGMFSLRRHYMERVKESVICLAMIAGFYEREGF